MRPVRLLRYKLRISREQLLPRIPERPCLALTWLLSCNLLLPDDSHRSFDRSPTPADAMRSAPPGQYSVCVHPGPQSLYLDPCQWGPPLSVNLGASAASVPLNLQKGVRFILRVHDTKRVLPQAETVAGTAVLVSVASPSAKQLSLPVVFSDGNVRDYGTVVPINAPMSATVSSNKVAISDKTGAALGASPIPFKVLPTDIEVAGAPRNQVTRMFPPPDAKMIHVYATGLK